MLASSLCTAIALTPQANAQTASSVTPSTFAPDSQRLTGRVVFSGERGTKAPAGSEKLLISLSGVNLDGAIPELAEVNNAIRARLTAKTITVAEIFNAASDLETAYAQRGYVLARVVLPAQSLRDGGRLRIVVVNGFIEKVDTSTAPLEVRARIDALTSPLIGKRSLRLPEIERQLLLAGDTFGVALGSALAAGAQPGATVLILQPEFRPVTGFVSLDNGVSSDLGPLTFGAGVELNSPLKLGETFYARLSAAVSGDNDNGLGGTFSADPRLRTISLGSVFPIGNDGLTLNVEVTDSRSAPDVLDPATTSEFRRYSARVFYPFIRSRNRNISGQLSFDRQSDRQFLVTAAGRSELYRDETSVLRAAIDGFWLTETGVAIEAGGVLSKGINGFGARDTPAAGESPFSRQGAQSNFTKLVATGRIRGKFNDKFTYSLAGRAQTSFGDPLITGEQFGIASSQELSAFDAGTIKGDSGWVLRGEVAMPQKVELGGRAINVSPYLFAAFGQVNLEQPTAAEQSKTRASAFGVGVDFNAFQKDRFSSATLRIEYGKGHRDDSLPDNDRFSIIGSFRF